MTTKANPVAGGDAPEAGEDPALVGYWLKWLLNLAQYCVANAHLKRWKGKRHKSVDFWQGLILHSLMGLPLDDGSDRLNDLLWLAKKAKDSHAPVPKAYGGQGDRHERLCPNGDQLRKYRNWLAKVNPRLLDHLNDFIFACMVKFALEHKYCKKIVDLLIDDTAQWYYGKDRFPLNPSITGTNKGPGTNHKRNYFACMLKAGKFYLYCGVFLVPKGESEVPRLEHVLDELAKMGVKVRMVMGDRWFPTFDLLDALRSRGVPFLGPYKRYPYLKKMMVKYLKTGGKYAFPSQVCGAPAGRKGRTPVEVTLIFTNPRGRRLSEIRADYFRGTKTEADCLKEIMIMVTTDKSPTQKKAKQSWAARLCQRYHVRWQIETGFRDVKRMTPESNARTNARKLLMFSARFWGFNLWQLARAEWRRQKRLGKRRRRSPTLRAFAHSLEMATLEVRVQ
jgi:hypothetical protein